MYVINRKHIREDVSYSRIRDKIKRFSVGLMVDSDKLAQEVIGSIYPGITTVEIDRHTTKLAYAKLSTHKDYGTLAGKLYVENIHRMTTEKFSEAFNFGQFRVDLNGDVIPLWDDEIYSWVMENSHFLDGLVKHERDYLFGYPALQMAESTYMTKLNFTNTKPMLVSDDAKKLLSKLKKPSTAVKRILDSKKSQSRISPQIYGYPCENGMLLVDRPQYVFLRCAIQCYWDQPDAHERIKTFYELSSLHYFTPPTPALLNACKRYKQLFSCFIMDIDDDLDGIYSTLKDVADISKRAGGTAVSLSSVRSSNQLIRTTNGMTSDMSKMLKLYDATSSYVNQGGVRKGNNACYMELHHPEILNILELRDPTYGDMKKKTLELFYSIWGNNLFYKRIQESDQTGEDVMWSFFDPDAAPGLCSFHSEDYERLYLIYEKDKLYTSQIPVHKLLNMIVRCIYNTGIPYTCQKDAVNFKSNHQGRGVIKGSNLCTEINEYFDFENPACCVLTSICLDSFVHRNKVLADGYKDKLMVCPTDIMAEARKFFSQYFDFDKLALVADLIVHNLNQCIMKNDYPLEKLREANIDYKPLGIGTQGLAKTFAYMRIPFNSPEGKILNMLIYETIYYASLNASADDALVFGKYKDFETSPLGQGLFQFDMWQREYIYHGPMDNGPTVHKNTNPNYSYYEFDREKNLTLEWDILGQKIAQQGVANSLLTSLMPTVSTSTFMNNADSECFEPFNTFFLQRTLLYGSTVIYNLTLYEDLIAAGLWNDVFYDKLKDNFGLVDEKLNESLGGIIPDWIIQLYRTVWSPGMAKTMIDYSRDRGPYICQSQSLNLYFRENDNNFNNILNALVYAWKCDLKTTSYYIRSKLDPGTKTTKEETPKVNSQSRDADRDEACYLIKNADGTTSKSCCSG